MTHHYDNDGASWDDDDSITGWSEPFEGENFCRRCFPESGDVERWYAQLDYIALQRKPVKAATPQPIYAWHRYQPPLTCAKCSGVIFHADSVGRSPAGVDLRTDDH